MKDKSPLERLAKLERQMAKRNADIKQLSAEIEVLRNSIYGLNNRTASLTVFGSRRRDE
jgi:cell division protein FtsB